VNNKSLQHRRGYKKIGGAHLMFTMRVKRAERKSRRSEISAREGYFWWSLRYHRRGNKAAIVSGQKRIECSVLRGALRAVLEIRETAPPLPNHPKSIAGYLPQIREGGNLVLLYEDQGSCPCGASKKKKNLWLERASRPPEGITGVGATWAVKAGVREFAGLLLPPGLKKGSIELGTRQGRSRGGRNTKDWFVRKVEVRKGKERKKAVGTYFVSSRGLSMRQLAKHREPEGIKQQSDEYKGGGEMGSPRFPPYDHKKEKSRKRELTGKGLGERPRPFEAILQETSSSTCCSPATEVSRPVPSHLVLDPKRKKVREGANLPLNPLKHPNRG